MVTLPPPGSDAAHLHRELAQSFGADAGRYDRARPGYPDALVDTIARRLTGRSILDVGIGTGISAVPFRDRGFDVLGLDPDPRMAELARAKGFAVELGRFEEWDAAGRLFDAVIAGQSWHWVDPAVGAVQAAAALRAGGILTVFWNAARPSPDLAAEFARVFASLDTGLPFNPWAAAQPEDPYRQIIDAAAAGLDATGAFGSLERMAFHWRETQTRDAWLDGTSTAGGINRLPRHTLAALLEGMGAAIDAAGGELVVERTTVAALAVRR